MLSNATSTTWINQHQRKQRQGEEDDRSRAVRTGSGQRGQVRKGGEKWTLILVRELRHSPEKVWQALTDPAHLREWAPFEVDGSLGTVGTVKLTWAGTPTPIEVPQHQARAATKGLEFPRGIAVLKQLGSVGSRHPCFVDRRFASMGAAGWHIAFDVLDRFLSGTPIGRIVRGDAMKFGGWQRLNSEYAKESVLKRPTGRLKRPDSRESRDRKTMHQRRTTMDTALWTVQLLCGVFFSVARSSGKKRPKIKSKE